jgi:hypothetical protein
LRNLAPHALITALQVRNLIAERDRSIQLQISNNTDRDGFNVLLINVLTVLFLPGTFMAVFIPKSPVILLCLLIFWQILLTTPMFDWSNTNGKVIVKLPFEIYWAFTGSFIVISTIVIIFRDAESFSRKVKWLRHVGLHSEKQHQTKSPV